MRDFKIYYGTEDVHIDITVDAFQTCLCTNESGYIIISIPKGDLVRKDLFNDDPTPGVPKSIYVYRNEKLVQTIDRFTVCEIPIFTKPPLSQIVVESLITTIHEKISLQHGNLMDNIIEQRIICSFMSTSAKVLEIGSNMGINSLVISNFINTDQNLVCIEEDIHNYWKSYENRIVNKKSYNIVNGEIGTVNNLDYFTIDELRSKYSIIFDTLVVTCKGTFHTILEQIPQVLDNIVLIIIKNDYISIDHKLFVDDVLQKENFYLVYSQQYIGAVQDDGYPYCKESFYEVWQKFNMKTFL